MKKIIVLISSVVFLLGFVAFTFASSSEWKNHGQYVRSQKNKREAAQSRIGMPVNSKGHTSDPNDQTIVINFDDLSVGQYGNSIAHYDGVTFSSEGTAFLVITDGSYDRGHGIEHSLPNKLSVFNPPSDLWIQFDYPTNSVSFWLSGAYKTRTIYAYDSDNNEVINYTQLYPTEEPLAPDETPWDFYYDRQEYFINLEGDNITKVLIQAVGHDSFSIDDLTYSP